LKVYTNRVKVSIEIINYSIRGIKELYPPSLNSSASVYGIL